MVTIANVPDGLQIPQNLREWLIAMRQAIKRARRPVYIPVSEFNGNPTLTEINGLGIFGAQATAVGDAFHHVFFVPKDFNIDTNTKIEVVWCTDNNTTTNTATWKIEYRAAATGEALGAASTALNSVIAADNVVGTYAVAVSPYGLIYAGAIEHEDLLHLKVSLSAVSGLDPAVDEIFLLGLKINDEG